MRFCGGANQRDLLPLIQGKPEAQARRARFSPPETGTHTERSYIWSPVICSETPSSAVVLALSNNAQVLSPSFNFWELHESYLLSPFNKVILSSIKLVPLIPVSCLHVQMTTLQFTKEAPRFRYRTVMARYGDDNTDVHPTSKKDLNTAQAGSQACTQLCPLTLSLALYQRPLKESERFQQLGETEGHWKMCPLLIRSTVFFILCILSGGGPEQPRPPSPMSSDSSADHLPGWMPTWAMKQLWVPGRSQSGQGSWGN